MGTKAMIAFRALHEDDQETQSWVYKNGDGFPETVHKEITQFFHKQAWNPKGIISDACVMATEFCRLYPQYTVVHAIWPYGYFYLLTIKDRNPNHDWYLTTFKWESVKPEEKYFK